MAYTLIPDLASRAEIPEAGTLSRVLHNDDRVRLVLFAFDAGQELSEHTAPFDALVHVIEGQAEIYISGQPFKVGANEAIIMPADQPHAVKAPQRFKMLLTMIRA